MNHFGIVYLDQADPEAAAKTWEDVTGYIAWDREADSIGAPQNVAALHGLLSLGKPVWYRGGMETVHTAELILGLGCEKVIVGKGFFKTERTPEHFARRLGEACVVVVRAAEQLAAALDAGAQWAYCEPTDGDSNNHTIVLMGEAATPWGIASLPA